MHNRRIRNPAALKRDHTLPLRLSETGERIRRRPLYSQHENRAAAPPAGSVFHERQHSTTLRFFDDHLPIIPVCPTERSLAIFTDNWLRLRETRSVTREGK